MQLTKDTDKFLCEIYAEFLSRRKSGLSKSSAKCFSAPGKLVTEFMQGTLPEDIYDCLEELQKVKFIRRNVTGSFRLEDSAIIYMEQRFKNGFKEVTDFIAKFIP